MLSNNEHELIYACDKCPGLFAAPDFHHHRELAAETPRLNPCSDAEMIPLGLLEDFLYSAEFHTHCMEFQIASSTSTNSSSKGKGASDVKSTNARRTSKRKAGPHGADSVVNPARPHPQKATKLVLQLKSKKAANHPPPEPELSKDEPPLRDASYARTVFWGTGSSQRSETSNSFEASSSQPASDPSDLSMDFPNEDLMTLFQDPPIRDLRGDYGRL